MVTVTVSRRESFLGSETIYLFINDFARTEKSPGIVLKYTMLANSNVMMSKTSEFL